MLLSSQFQGFCRDLHSECVDHLVAVVPVALKPACRLNFLHNRKLDRGNPNPGNIGADFDRLGLSFWPAVRAVDMRNQSRQTKLESLNGWRNAVAHQDFSQVEGDSRLRLGRVTDWRSATSHLARSFDQVLGEHLRVLTMNPPW